MSAFHRTLAAGIAMLALASLTASLALAWPNDPAVNLLLGTSSGFDGSPAITTDGAGGSLVVYPVDAIDLEVKRLDRYGRVLWTCAVLGDPSYALARFPAIASDGSGGAFVAYQDGLGTTNRIVVQRISGSGTRPWGGNGVVACGADNYNPMPEIVPDGAGGAIVAWRDSHLGTLHVAAQRLTGAGTPLWTTDGVALSSGVAQHWGTVRMRPDGGGGALLAWDDSLGFTIDIRAQRVSPSGAPLWGAGGLLVQGGAYYYQSSPAIAEDGQGGAYVMYADKRSGGVNGPFLQHIDENGSALWAAGGLLLNGTSESFDYDVMPDGAGGAIATWEAGVVPDQRVRVQRLDPAGNALWTSGGVALRALETGARHPQVTPDGSGGATVSWWDERFGNGDLYAQRVSATGVVQWTPDGAPLSTATGDQWNHMLCPDGLGGAVAVFNDSRAGDYASYAQRIDGWGVLAGEPLITRFRDAVSDQGGYGHLQWSRSPLDAGAPNGLSAYWLWRQVPAAAAQAALARGARHIDGDEVPDVDPRGAVTTTQVDGATWYWEALGGVTPTGAASYEMLVQTACDSIVGQAPKRTVYMVMARGAGGVGFWTSPPDSGYSIDNLAPGQPDPVSGTYIPAAFATSLSWGPVSAPDLAGYRIHRGTTPSFTIGPANYAGFTSDIAYVDYAGQPYYYQVLAVDLHGNTGPANLIVPSGIADAEHPAPRALALSAPAPNPLRSSTTLRLSLPVAAHVACAMFDAQGRQVRALVDGERAAGTHALVWDGRDDEGRPVPNGLYLARVVSGGRTFTRRIVAVR